MSSFTIFILCFTLVVFSSGELLCGLNEQVIDCPANCASENCPKDEHSDDEPCVTPPVQCPAPACKCLVNHRRAENGTCIPTEQCPPFDCSKRQNEVYNPCPPYCPSEDCSYATVDGKCHIFGHILILRICSPTCRCAEGFWRKNGICVPYKDCGK